MSDRCGATNPEHPEWGPCLLSPVPHPSHDAGDGNGWINTEVRDQRIAGFASRPGAASKQERRDRLKDLAGVGAPGVKIHSDPQDTELDAALATLPRSGTQRRRVYDALVVAAVNGLTDEEIQNALQMNPSTVRPRRGELVEGGFVIDSGMRRRVDSGENAIVWMVSAH